MTKRRRDRVVVVVVVVVVVAEDRVVPVAGGESGERGVAPVMVSAPSSPSIMSSPSRPAMTSAPFVPVRVSLPLVPSMVAVRLLQLAVAWATGAITNDPTITATPATRRQRPPGAIHTEWSGIAADKLLATSGHRPLHQPSHRDRRHPVRRRQSPPPSPHHPRRSPTPSPAPSAPADPKHVRGRRGSQTTHLHPPRATRPRVRPDDATLPPPRQHDAHNTEHPPHSDLTGSPRPPRIQAPSQPRR